MEVEREIAILKPRVAEIRGTVIVDGADIHADDIPVCTSTIESSCIGKSPLTDPIMVNPGRHKITASKKGYVTATSLVSVVGSDKTDIKLELVSLDRPKEWSNPWITPTVIGWSATGVAAISAGVLGGMALSAQSDQEAALARSGATNAELNDARDKTQTLATVSDVLWITTGVFGIASAYFTLRAVNAKAPEGAAPPPAPAAKVRFSPFGAYGTF